MEVKTIAVIGAGAQGREIAYASALGGYKTVLEDISPHVLNEAMAWIRRSFAEGVSWGKLQASFGDKGLSLLSTAADVKDARTSAIFASTALSLSITDFTDIVVSRERCIGMHFPHPVSKGKLLELLRTPYTSEDTVAICREVARRMGKEVAVVNEAPQNGRNARGLGR